VNIRRYLTTLALLGVALGLAVLFSIMHKGSPTMHAGGATTTRAARPMIAPAESPFPTFVAGAGIVEASTENIAIGTPLAGIAADIYVGVGSQVRRGDPLFSLDSRATRAELLVRRAAVDVADVRLADAENEFARVRSLGDAISVKERDQRRYAAMLAQTQLALARAELRSTETDLARMTVRAPVDGEVLQLKLHPGEFAAAGAGAQPLLLLGTVEPMNVRVDVDENDAWRVEHSARAMAFLKGNATIKTPLEFVRLEPYVVPKRALTGESTERVDTRVLQAIYRFERGDLPIYVGQQMHVFIEAVGHTGQPPAQDDRS